jgi:nitrate/nitrite-specific signal transduction histidine kinase
MKVPGQRPPAPEPGGEALNQLQSLLDRARELASALKQSLPAEAPRSANLDELHARLADLESDRTQLSMSLQENEQQTGRLMNLYVATYQLHATLDPVEVQSTIAEITINLLGAERFALLFWKRDDSECEITLGQGLEDDPSGLFTGGKYSGGDPALDATLTDGVLRIGPLEGSNLLATVPLTVQGTTVGALAILKLFDHKPTLRIEDRELLDLLAAHAASALFAARVYSATDRKLKTLENLVNLLRKG